MGVEKLIHSKMLVKDSYRRIFNISKHSGMVHRLFPYPQFNILSKIFFFFFFLIFFFFI